MSKRIFMTGGTGFIGTALVDALADRGDLAVVLTRDHERGRKRLGYKALLIEGDPTRDGPWYEEIDGCDAVINLAGAPISGKRWSSEYMRKMRDSRVQTTRALVRALGALPEDRRPRVLVSASAVDLYPFEEKLTSRAGWEPGEEVTEEGPYDDSFLSRLCQTWEEEARRAEQYGVRVVVMRTGVVLGEDGALPLITRPFKLYLGGPLGKGDQWFSWIHVHDVVAGYLHALDDDQLSGPVNLVAPEAVRNREFAHALGEVLHRPSWLPAPELALRLALGELAEHLTHGRRAVPTALIEHGFDFAYPTIDKALANTPLCQ
jgi:uncharacterized protein